MGKNVDAESNKSKTAAKTKHDEVLTKVLKVFSFFIKLFDTTFTF